MTPEGTGSSLRSDVDPLKRVPPQTAQAKPPTLELAGSLEQVRPPFLLTVSRILDFDPMPSVGIVLVGTVFPLCFFTGNYCHLSNIAQTATGNLWIIVFSNRCELKLNGKPIAVPNGDSRISQFLKCSMVLVDLLQRDYELSSLERVRMDNYLRLIDISYNSWKQRMDGPPKRLSKK